MNHDGCCFVPKPSIPTGCCLGISLLFMRCSVPYSPKMAWTNNFCVPFKCSGPDVELFDAASDSVIWLITSREKKSSLFISHSRRTRGVSEKLLFWWFFMYIFYRYSPFWRNKQTIMKTNPDLLTFKNAPGCHCACGMYKIIVQFFHQYDTR